jgi:hypothetical protein
MKKYPFRLLLPGLVFLILASCNEPEPEQLVIKAEIPASVTLKTSYSVSDTFKFTIESEEAAIDSVQLYEESNMLVGLSIEQFGSDKRDLELNLLYNPNSTGTKNFEMRVRALPYRKSFFFTVEVVE